MSIDYTRACVLTHHRKTGIKFKKQGPSRKFPYYKEPSHCVSLQHLVQHLHSISSPGPRQSALKL